MQSIFYQQIFALDAKYNAQRAPNCQNFRTLYIRRRNQLLRENCQLSAENFQSYLKTRFLLLQQRYGSSFDNHSSHSRKTSISLRSGSRLSETNNGSNKLDYSLIQNHDNSANDYYAFSGVYHIFDHHKNAVTMIKFANNDRTRLLCASNDSTLSICVIEANESPYVAVILKGHKQAVTACDWSASNDLLLSSSDDGTIRLWDAKSAKCIRVIQQEKIVCPIKCCLFQPANSNLIIYGNNRGEVRVVNISTGRSPPGGFCRINGIVLSLCCDNNGRLIWASNNKGEIISMLCDVSGRLRKSRKIQISSNDTLITNISWRSWISRDDKDPILLINSSDASLFLFRVIDNEGTLQYKWKWPNKHLESNMIRSTFCPIMSFRRGACVVTGSDDGKVYFVDIERPTNHSVVTLLQGHSAPSLGISFNYDETFLATSDKQGLVIIWKRCTQFE